MKTEIEVKFVDVDIDEIRSRLQAIGAECAQPMRAMRRQVFYLVDRSKDAYVRVRDEGDKVTMTYKQFEEAGLHGAKEIEVVVSDFADAIDIISQSGLEQKSYQETRRETWHIGTTEVVIDEWPWLRPFIEIEGQSEADVREVAAKLQFDWNDAVFGAVTAAYRM
jgi:adenylate cyclase class 2